MSNRSMHAAETWTLFSAVHMYVTSTGRSSSIIVFVLCSQSVQVHICHTCTSLMILPPHAIWSSYREMSKDMLVQSACAPCWGHWWHTPGCRGCCHGLSPDPPYPSKASLPPPMVGPISDAFRSTSNPTGSLAYFSLSLTDSRMFLLAFFT